MVLFGKKGPASLYTNIHVPLFFMPSLSDTWRSLVWVMSVHWWTSPWSSHRGWPAWPRALSATLNRAVLPCRQDWAGVQEDSRLWKLSAAAPFDSMQMYANEEVQPWHLHTGGMDHALPSRGLRMVGTLPNTHTFIRKLTHTHTAILWYTLVAAFAISCFLLTFRIMVQNIMLMYPTNL